MSRNFELLQKVEQGNTVELGNGNGSAGSESSVPTFMNAVQPTLNPACETQISNLIQRLFLTANGVKVVLFSGLERQVGCSWIAAHSARMLASQVRQPVCVVDANFRFPSLHDHFSIVNHHGLADAVHQNGSLRDFIVQAAKNLWLLSCGSPEKLNDATLAAAELRSRITQLRNDFQYVLIDTSTFSGYADAATLSPACDGLVLVFKANYSRRDTAQKALLLAQASGARVLGAVLNQRTYPVPQSLYARL